jgi:dTDP-4-dehydrorhamnose 3,5-epimerase
MASPTKIESVASQAGDVAAAYARARAELEPMFVPAPVYTDDRGWSLMNQLQGVMAPEGQINYSVTYPGVIKAWHRHQHQTDFWIVLMGHLKVGVHRDDGRTWRTVIGEKKPGILIIPPPLWHGAATVSQESAGLLYYVTKAYDAQQPDEERRAFDSVPGFTWSVEHK